MEDLNLYLKDVLSERPHTSVHTTEIYADVVMEKKADAVNLVTSVFG